MVNNWKHLNFFDKNGKYLNFNYNQSEDMWSGTMYLPEVSIGLFEVGQIFILEEFVNKTTNLKEFGFPHGVEVATGTPGSTGGVCNWQAEWSTTDPNEIFLFQFNMDFDTGTQTSLEMEPDGPPLQIITELEIPLNSDPTETIDSEGYTVTDKITSEALQINIAIRSETENTFKRTLYINDECTGKPIAEILIYGETTGEDERLKVMTQNMGYNILESDSEIFRNTNIKELLPNFDEVNLKRKEIMMEGSNIYPFIGSYKGLTNAIKFFGYDTLKVREFWRNVDANSPMFGKYIMSNNIDIGNPTVQLNDKKITLPNKKFRKTSLFSLVYRINNIIPDKFDEESLPITKENYDFTIEEILIKLFGLKKKLENEFLPLNARIKDITGEADFFGLLEVVNTLSRNDKKEIVAGIDTNFKLSTTDCILMEDLRSFTSFCIASEGIVDEAIVNFCNAYVAPLSSANAIGRNLLLGPISPGEILPPSPIGPDLNSSLGGGYDGSNVTVEALADAFLAYFTRYAPNLNRVGAWPDGESSYYLPDKPGIPIGAMTILENDSFNNITWDNVDSTWNQLNDANKFFTFDIDPQGVAAGDVFTINDPDTNTGATYTAIAGDTDTDVRNALYDQLILLIASFTEPWIFWDVTKETGVTGDVIRVFGQNVDRLKVTCQSIYGSQLLFNQLPGETLFTWDGIERGNFEEIEWTIYKEETDISPSYYKVFRGPLSQYNKLPIILPYVGTYSVEMKLFDLYNNISSNVKTDFICVESREVEYSGWYQARKARYSWNSEAKHIWNDYGSLWNLPIAPTVTWDEESPSLYESLDRVNAILNNFGLGTSPDFQLLNYQDDGKASFSGPYQWKNLTTGGWNDTYHLWWDMTSTSGDTPAFFQFKEVLPETYLQITDLNDVTAEYYFDSTVTTLADAAAGLNVSTDPIINKYVYNVVYDATSNQMFVQAVCRYFGLRGDFKYVDMVYADGTRVCEGATSTGNYIGGPLTPTTLYPPFDRSLAINGSTLVALPSLGGTNPVTDEFVKKVARVYEMILDPDAVGITYNKQAAVLQSLKTKKTIQRIGYNAMGDYTPSLGTYPGWDNTNDNNANVDFIWEWSSGTPNDQITEVLEHALHTITTFGLPGAFPIEFNQTTPSGPTYNAMTEAINNGVFDISGYSPQPGDTNDEFQALLMREYLYLLIYAEWGFIASYVSGGSLAPEWTATTPALVASQNPLGHSLYVNYISTVLAKPSTSILDSMFAIGGVSGYIPFENISASGTTGATGATGCSSLIYRKGQSISSNPTWNTAKFINDGKVLPKMTWLMFVYDKCKIPGKGQPRWIIKNTTNSSVADIYFESKYLTYLFKIPGKYEITLELTDTNGNKYKKDRNILVIK